MHKRTPKDSKDASGEACVFPHTDSAFVALAADIQTCHDDYLCWCGCSGPKRTIRFLILKAWLYSRDRRDQRRSLSTRKVASVLYKEKNYHIPQLHTTQKKLSGKATIVLISKVRKSVDIRIEEYSFMGR